MTRAQATTLGATKGVIQHRLAAGRWERVAAGVFRIAGSAPSWEQSLMAARLARGADAVVSHLSAGALWRLPGFETRALELTSPRRCRVDAPGVVHTGVLAREEVTRARGFPVTTVARTLLDVATAVSRDVLEEALDDALRRRILTVPRLRRQLTGTPRGRRGLRVMRELAARFPRASWRRNSLGCCEEPAFPGRPFSTASRWEGGGLP